MAVGFTWNGGHSGPAAADGQNDGSWQQGDVVVSYGEGSALGGARTAPGGTSLSWPMVAAAAVAAVVAVAWLRRKGR